jgi:hypothetical protein
MAHVSSPAIRQKSSEHSISQAAAGQAPTSGTQIACLRNSIRYSDLVVLGARVGRPWFRYTRDGHYMVEVGWEGGGPNTTHCLSELKVIRSNDRFACI